MDEETVGYYFILGSFLFLKKGIGYYVSITKEISVPIYLRRSYCQCGMYMRL